MTTSRANSGTGAGGKPPAKLKPTVFGRYLLLDRVAAGGMAEVWRAKVFGTDDFQRIIAIKKILPHVVEDPEFIQMFKDEAKITVQLQHSNIGQVYELNKVDETFYIAMEYISGKDAKTVWSYQRQRNEPLPIPMACLLTQKMCEGLDYAHRKKDNFGVDLKIVHRDVSPQNVLISWEGEVKVIDFGIAKAAGKASKTQAGILKGKFGYMAPEQVRGMPLDQRADVFAMGVCLYEYVTGERAFVADSDFSLLEMVRNVEIKPPSLANANVPPEVERIIYKSLAKDPDDRYQYGSDMAEDLQRFMLMQGKAPSRHDLAEYLKACFPADYDRERLRMESYRDLEMPELPKEAPVVAAGPPPPKPVDLSSAAVLAAMAEDNGAGADPNDPFADITGPPAASPENSGVHVQARQVTGIRPAATITAPPPAAVAPVEESKSGGIGKTAAIAGAVVVGVLAIAVAVGVLIKGTGTISVTVAPDGAEVFLDGESRGVTKGDLTLEGVATGQHLVKASKDGFLPETVTVTVARNGIVPANLKLAKKPDPTGLVTLRSKPGGAAIIVDGADTGKKTPAELDIKVGEHTIELRAKNYRRTEKTLKIEAEKKYDEEFTLSPERVNLELRTMPLGATVFDSGKQKLGVTPWIYKDMPVDPPFPELTFDRKGCKPYTTTVSPDENQGVDQTRTLELKCN